MKTNYWMFSKFKTFSLVLPFFFPSLGFWLRSEIPEEIVSLVFLSGILAVLWFQSPRSGDKNVLDVSIFTGCVCAVYCICFFVRHGFVSLYVPIRILCVYSGYMAARLLPTHKGWQWEQAGLFILLGEVVYWLVHLLCKEVDYFPNNSIFSIVFAAQFAFILPGLMYKVRHSPPFNNKDAGLHSYPLPRCWCFSFCIQQVGVPVV